MTNITYTFKENGVDMTPKPLSEYNFNLSVTERITLISGSAETNYETLDKGYTTYSSAVYRTENDVSFVDVTQNDDTKVFSSADEDIATIDQTGKVTWVSDGSARIIVEGEHINKGILSVVSQDVMESYDVFTGFVDGSTAQSIATGATYTKLTGFDTDGESSNATNDVANDKITLTKTGRYHISYSLNGSSGTANVTFKTALFVGGTEMGQVHSNRKYGAAGDIGSESGTGIVDITSENTDLDLRMRHDNGGAVNFTPIYMSLVATYLGET